MYLYCCHLPHLAALVCETRMPNRRTAAIRSGTGFILDFAAQYTEWKVTECCQLQLLAILVVAIKLCVFIVYMHVASMISCLTDCHAGCGNYCEDIPSLNMLSHIMREKSN